jgi:hypothetical protein
MTSDADEFVSTADAPEWWLLAILSEHFKMVREALQGRFYLLEQNNQRIKTLRVEMCELHGVKALSACEQDSSLDCNDPDFSIATAGSGVETVATLGRFSICCGDVLKDEEVYGLDAGNALEYLDDCDEEKRSVVKYVTAEALTTVHGHYLMELDAEKEGLKIPPTLPLSFNALSPGHMQDLLRSFRPRMLVSLPAGAPHAIFGEHLKLKRLLRRSMQFSRPKLQHKPLNTRLQSVFTSVGALCVTSFLPCVCLRAGLRPCFQEARR